MKLELRGLTKRFGNQTVLDSLDLLLPNFHVLALLGPSGGGKSTLLRILAGLLPASDGEVHLNDEAVPKREKELRAYRSRLGTVFQSFNLFPHLTALENIALPLRVVHRQERKGAEEQAMELLRRFRLDQHAAKNPGQLSGGQKQRVAIARALSAKPALLLFDEPTSALDPEMTSEVLEMIAELRAEGRNLILVTHEIGFAREVSDNVAFLADAKIVEAGESSTFFKAPTTEAARRFLDQVLRY